MSSGDAASDAGREAAWTPATLASLGLSVVRDDPAFRLQRKLGLVPETGLGIVPRAVSWSLLAWLPIAAWAAWTGRAIAQTAGEPLLAHFGIHVRFLVAIPLSKSSVLPLVLAAVGSMLIVLALAVPVGQLLANVVKALL